MSATILLLHGFASSPDRDYPSDELPRLLEAGGARVLRHTLLGHGGSTPEAAVLGVPEQLAAISETLAAQDATPTGVVGYSLGARLAWELLGSPGLERAVLGGAAAREPMAAVDVAAIESGREELDPMTARIASLLGGPSERRSGLLAVLRGLQRDGFVPTDRAAGTRVLLLAGIDDQMAAPETLAEHVPDAGVERLPGGHVDVLHSAAYLERVARFLLAD